jgi:hypothetical protein
LAICPSCQAQIEIGSEFFGGLFTCPACGAVYFIGFDGNPEQVQTPVAEVLPEVSPHFTPYENQPYEPEPIQFASVETFPPPLESHPLQEVVDFANGEGTPSLVVYSLEIRGLQSAQNINAMKDLLIDSKLQISFEELKPRIQNGVLKIEKLNPAQAAILAFRLRPLALEVKWEQKIL